MALSALAETGDTSEQERSLRLALTVVGNDSINPRSGLVVLNPSRAGRREILRRRWRSLFEFQTDWDCTRRSAATRFNRTLAGSQSRGRLTLTSDATH